MRFIVLLSLAALAIASPVDQVKSTNNPDISKLPLDNIPKPSDPTKTSFQTDNTKTGASQQPLNIAKPQTSTNNEKTTVGAHNNSPQTTSNIQKIPTSTQQKNQPQSGFNNNNQHQPTTSTLNNQRTQPSLTSNNNNNYNNNQRTQPLNTHSNHPQQQQQPLLSASTRVRRDTVKSEAPKSSAPAATLQLQNAQKNAANSQKLPAQVPSAGPGNNRKTREVPKDDKSQKPQVNSSNLPRVPLTNGNSANVKPQVNAQQNPSASPIRKTRETPKDVKTPQVSVKNPTNVAKPAPAQVHKNAQAAQQTPSTSAPIRKTREAPKDVKQTSVPAPVTNHNSYKVQPQPVNTQKSQQSGLNPSTSASPIRKTPAAPKDVKTPVNNANPSTTAPVRKTRETPKDVKTPTNVAKPAQTPVRKNSQIPSTSAPVNKNAQQTPSTSAPVRKTREAPNPSEQSKIVPTSHPALPLASSSPADNKSPTFIHPVPVDHILKKPDVTATHPVHAVKTENKPQTVGEQKPLIDQAKSPLPASIVHQF